MKHHLLKIKHPKYALSLLFLVILFGILIASCPRYNRKSITAITSQTSSNLNKGHWKLVVAGDGDSLDSIFYQLGLSRATLAKIMKLPEAENYLDPLRLDQHLYFKIKSHVLKELKVPIDLKRTLFVENNNDKVSAKLQVLPIDTALVYAEGIHF